ncbi:methyltransferase type 12 [Methylobacterium brachiatum]
MYTGNGANELKEQGAGVDGVSLRLQSALDGIVVDLKGGKVEPAIRKLFDELSIAINSVDGDRWSNELIAIVRNHEIFNLMMECPFTSHSYNRPRGYPGDAALLDIIYEHPSSRESLKASSDIGLEMLASIAKVDACKAVRFRRELIASKIDAAAKNRSDLRVLSLACGHLREFEYSAAIRNDKVVAYTALDQDPISLDVVRSYGGCVSPQKVSVKDVLIGRNSLTEHDIVYSAGLYDYLDEATAKQLTKKLFDLVSPGGQLMVANFVKGIREQGYMEVFMRWDLIYRSSSEIRDLSAHIPTEQISSIDYFEDETKTVGYLVVNRN